MLVFFGAAFFAGAFFAGDFFFAGVFFAGTIFLLDFERSIRRYPDRRVVESGNNHEAIGKLRQLYMAVQFEMQMTEELVCLFVIGVI